MAETSDPLTMSQPAEYRICVQGAIERSWSDLFDGMKVSYRHVATPNALTVLTGGALDQAALMGLLNRLYGLGLPLVSVQLRRSQGKRMVKSGAENSS
jgi:hypothetical protein